MTHYKKLTTHYLIRGGLAQLARALALHARGHRFDSDILHNEEFIDIIRKITYNQKQI